jgi:hypothetical protein
MKDLRLFKMNKMTGLRYVVWGFEKMKKKYTFATDYGLIVQWIPACRQAGNGGLLNIK